MHTFRIIPLILFMLMVLTTAASADLVIEDWNDGDAGGWQANTLYTEIEIMPAGGVDDSGYLHSNEGASGIDIVGAVQGFPPYIGDYNSYAYSAISVSLNFFSVGFGGVNFRVRYLDSGHNGWTIELTNDFSVGEWRYCGIEFDPAWEDMEAIAAGWVQEPNSASFAETMANVYSAEIRAWGAGFLELGIDNFTLSEELIPVESSSWSDLKSLY